MTPVHEVQRPPTRVPRYEAPASLGVALDLLADLGERARPVAGGTDLLVELDRGAHPTVEALVDVGGLPGLDEITEDDDGALRLGALVTHNQVVASAPCRHLALPLAQACLEVGSPQLRNRATVAGNVATASPANDTISALLALGAEIELQSVRGRRQLPVEAFITGFRTTDRAPDELITALIVPTPRPGTRAVFVKLGLRRAQAISVVHLSASVTLDDNARVVDTTIAVGSVAPTVVVVPDGADVLRGRRLDEAAIGDVVAATVRAIAPIDDLRAPASYRADLAATMTARALRTLAADTQAQCWPPAPPLLWRSGFEGRFPARAPVSIGPDDPIQCELNGRPHQAAAASGTTLLDWLRDRGGALGVKEGCAEGECGACTVELDGAAVMSCLVPAGRAAGATIVTVEGLGPRSTVAPATEPALHPIQRAFVETGAVQCGFCTPGFLMACATLLDEHPDPTPAQVRAGLAGNICRCTGYRSIESAVDLASERAR